jgi:hypothetical protein
MTTFSTESALFVGDTHADTGWLKFAVLPTAKKMGIATIIQVGDFGYLPAAREFLNAARKARQRFGVDICASVYSRSSAFHPSFHPSHLSDGTRQNRQGTTQNPVNIDKSDH